MGECDRCDQVPASFWSVAISHFLFASSSFVAIKFNVIRIKRIKSKFIPTKFTFLWYTFLFASRTPAYKKNHQKKKRCSVYLMRWRWHRRRRWSCRRRHERIQQKQQREKKNVVRTQIHPENERFFFPLSFLEFYCYTIFRLSFWWCGIHFVRTTQRNEKSKLLSQSGCLGLGG